MQQPPTESTRDVGSELRSDAQHIGSSAANFLHSEVDSRKGSVAGQARSASSAIRRAADELDDGVPAWLKSTFQQGADQIQRFADTLEQKGSRELVEQVQSFARERPGTFLAACAAAGFAAARVFRAGGEQPDATPQAWAQSPSSEQWTGSPQPQSSMPQSSPGELV